MTPDQLKEILRAARARTEETEFYIIGSAAVLHIFNTTDHHLLTRSNEADLIPISGDSETADILSNAIGELSPFHANHHVYAEGVTFETPTFAPRDWQARTIEVFYSDIGVTAHFMELHDLALSKLGAGRPKDMEFCEALAKSGYLNKEVLLERLAIVQCNPGQRELFRERIQQIFT